MEIRKFGYLIVTDYIPNDGKTDVSDALQELIDNNPNRTLFFPDGVYMFGKTVYTPADPRKSVDLQLSNFAVLTAMTPWSGGPIISLGGKDPYNDITIPGSNYSLTGGFIDCQNEAEGVEIAGGRETRIFGTCIKNTTLGLHILFGANGGSSDCDIRDINITGAQGKESTGIIIDGYDNSLTNIRIGRITTGVINHTGGNTMKNIHPLVYFDEKFYDKTVGFIDTNSNNTYDYCYADNFAVGFKVIGNGPNNFQNCIAYWYKDGPYQQTLFESDGKFNSVIFGMRAGFKPQANATMFKIKEPGGNGVIYDLIASRVPDDKDYLPYMKGNIIKW